MGALFLQHFAPLLVYSLPTLIPKHFNNYDRIIPMTQTEQTVAAKNFSEEWKDKGYEKGESIDKDLRARLNSQTALCSILSSRQNAT